MLSWLQISDLKNALEPSALLGHCPIFDRQDFIERMQKALKLNIDLMEYKWGLSELEIAKSRQLPDTLRYLFLAAPLDGLFELYLPKIQLDQVINYYFEDQVTLSESMRAAFLDFFTAQLMSALCLNPALDFIKPTLANRSQKVSSATVLEGFFVFKFDAFELMVQILVDDTLYQQWLKHWQLNPSLQIESQKAKAIELNLDLKLGHIELSAQTLAQLQVGDWLTLHELGIQEPLELNQVDLMLGPGKIGRAQLSTHDIKILSRDDFFDRVMCK